MTHIRIAIQIPASVAIDFLTDPQKGVGTRFDGGTVFSWAETLTFPGWLGGRIGELIGGPILRLIWRRNLRMLARRFTPA